MNIRDSLSFDDVLLIPRYSEIVTRHDINLGNNLGKINFDIPIISSPMDTVTEVKMARTMDEIFGGLGIIHRYMSIDKQSKMIERVIKKSKKTSNVNVGFAVGVKDDYMDRIEKCHKSGGNVICVDVAHGHHVLMKDALKNIKKEFPDVHVMAGNVATPDGFLRLIEWGADSVRCGIGGGSICSTRIEVGHGVSTLQTVIDCNEIRDKENINNKIIVDGGIRISSDIVKALAAGADFCMVGSLLAGTNEAPGKVYKDKVTGEKWKVYRGMASKEAQIDWKKTFSSNEGITSRVKYKGKLENYLNEILFNVKSGLSYSGANNIYELRNNVSWVFQTFSGQIESSTHILNR
jgi:IMP dehydrogenase